MANTKNIKDVIKEEYIKCAKDPIYFMKKYVKIQHPLRGTIAFDTYPFQDNTLNDLVAERFNIILKSRQMGITTLVAAYALHLMTFNNDKNILCLSITQETSKEIVTKVRFANDNLPSWLKVQASEDNRLSLKLKNGSKITAASSAGTSGRSSALSLLIIDEAAFIDGIEEIWLSAQSTLSTGGKATILSCVTADTYIFDEKIGLTQISNYIQADKIGPYIIKEYGVLGKNRIRNGTLFHNNGKVDTNIIKTKFSELECSLNHKLWAYKVLDKKYGWVKSEDLKVGDFLSIQRGMNIWINNDSTDDFMPSVSPKIKSPFNPKKLTPDICYLLGLYISEGSVYKVKNKDGELIGGTLTITCGDGISQIFDKLSLTYSTSDNLHYCVSNKNLIEFLEYLGFDLSLHANKKIIPQRLMSISKDNMVYLMRGIFDGDGSGTANRVTLGVTSSELISQVRMILNNFGILCSRFHHSSEKKNSYGGRIKHNHSTHTLEIYGRNALKFFNEINFGIERKSTGVKKILKNNLKRTCSHDVIPNSLSLVKELYVVSGENTRTIKDKFGLQLNGVVSTKTRYKTENVSADNVRIMYYNYKHLLSEKSRSYWDNIIDDSTVWCEIKSMTRGRSETYDFSLPDNPDDNWDHSVVYNGIVGHQTPNGVGNFFHKKWAEAESGEVIEGMPKFNPISLPWHLHPERDQTWRDLQTKNLGPKGAAQECDCEFSTSGNTVIEIPLLQWYEKNHMRDPMEKRGFDKGYWIYKYPEAGKSYMVVGDVARGDGTDYSAAHIIEIETMEQVAEYKGKLPTKEYAHALMTMATEYNKALLVIENANVGWAVIQEVIDKNYDNLFYSSSDLQYVDVETQMTNKINTQEKKMTPGFTTSSKSRPLLISKLESYIRNKEVIIHSRRLLDELNVFIWKSTGTSSAKAEAMDGYNDDLVMAMAIGLWIRDVALRLRSEADTIAKTILSKIGSTSSEQIKNNVSSVYKSQSNPFGAYHNPWRMHVGGGSSGSDKTEDITWLLR
jgi:intein/homing endonuclease